MQFSGRGSGLVGRRESVPNNVVDDLTRTTWQSPLSLDLDSLSEIIGGTGRANLIWDCLRHGVDPLDLNEHIDFDNKNNTEDSTTPNAKEDMKSPMKGVVLGNNLRELYLKLFGGRIEDQISRVTKLHVSRDGTVKLLLQLLRDGYEVETVIIPWEDRQKSTLCISSQVGCRQGCTFCLTGRMGKIRSLSADEILSQVFHALAVTHRGGFQPYSIDNIVFMGMGEPGDNAAAVVTASQVLVRQFRLAPRRITISTVAPTPTTFSVLGQAPAILAWSVHSSRNEIRRQLVPTTKYTMEELREGLIAALQQRPRRYQSILLEVTLLDKINDSLEDAHHLADFCLPILERLPQAKVVVNLIPWNDISATSGPAKLYSPPLLQQVLDFQQALVDRGVRCYVRKTRGEDANAACGQLATKRNI